jgi:L-seryl-tRNA(Ser) seleniumtransferase
MASSGTHMIEVGTTNRTHLHDYQRAINSNTRLIMRVHPSNYRIVGFASSPERSELVTLAHQAGLLLYEDAGSGQLDDLRKYGVIDEPVVREIIEVGVDVTSFSGDKLLGSVQAGLIVGRQEIVSRLRKHPLYRALRSDKIRLAALEATLVSHQKGMGQAEVPVIQILSLATEEIRRRAQSIVDSLSTNELQVDLLEDESALGGGAGPTSTFPTTVIALTHRERSAQEIEHQLRTSSPPIIGRISAGKVLLDLRTVFDDQLPALREALSRLN